MNTLDKIMPQGIYPLGSPKKIPVMYLHGENDAHIQVETERTRQERDFINSGRELLDQHPLGVYPEGCECEVCTYEDNGHPRDED